MTDVVTMHLETQAHEDGQFDDAPDATPAPLTTIPPQFNPREGSNFIDEGILEWSEHEETEDSGAEDDWEENRVEDEDWEISERGMQHLWPILLDSSQWKMH